MVIREQEDFEFSSAARKIKQDSTPDRSGFGLQPWIKSKALLLNGRSTACSELIYTPRNQPSTLQTELDFYGPLLDEAERQGSRSIFAVGATSEFCRSLEGLGFKENTELVRRRRYLGVRALTGHSKVRRFGMRGIARVSRQIRNRMIESSLGEDSFRSASVMFETLADRMDVAFNRPEEELMERYRDSTDKWGILFLRRKVGMANNSYVIFREHQDSKGREVLSLDDYWTSDFSYRSMLWLMGEISLWALGVGFDIIDNTALKGSYSDRCFIALGGIRKKETIYLYERCRPSEPMTDFSSGHIRSSDFSLLSHGDE